MIGALSVAFVSPGIINLLEVITHESVKVRTGVYVCHCGTNIAGKVDVGAVAEYARTLDNVVLARDYTYMCSDPVKT